MSTKPWTAVKATTWLHPLVKNELERRAQLTGASLSKVMAGALEEWVHQDIHAQHDTLLYPVVRQVIHEEFRAFANRIIFFLLRIAFAAEQSRILITNVLERVLRLFLKNTEEAGKTHVKLVDQSNLLARRNGSPPL
jgi:hypothetical protein